jgi:hypothetical protein
MEPTRSFGISVDSNISDSIAIPYTYETICNSLPCTTLEVPLPRDMFPLNPQQGSQQAEKHHPPWYVCDTAWSLQDLSEFPWIQIYLTVSPSLTPMKQIGILRFFVGPLRFHLAELGLLPGETTYLWAQAMIVLI